ncbi:phage major capsid protein [Thomasclavelia cocleata]|uniref:phage major capsid protein n=1 Tax=Thomasclavelia cocleata TaxID=69824 RepID=UPI002432E28E|nr:phage major capsid protein [Thomasclavelia cocleata]
MNKKMREILAKIEEKRTQAKAFMSEGENKDVDKATKLLDECDELQKEYDAEARLYEKEKQENAPDDEKIKGIKKKKEKNDVIKQFAEDARKGFPRNKTMSEGAPADGGYTVPDEIVTKVQERRSAKASLLDEVTVIPVKTNKGSRTFKKRSQQTGFQKVGEGAKIGKKNTPQFERINYEISKYAGYFPMTNELIEDSDENLTKTLIEWIGDESRVTANKLILEKVATKEEVDLKDLDGIKKALNVTLGQAFKQTSSIRTNDDGLQYLDTLKDANGRDLLQPNPTQPAQLQLRAGATAVPVKVYPNEDFPTKNNKLPFIIGDLKEGINYFDRKQLSIKASDTAVMGDLNAFEEDLSIWRAIEREDVQVADDQAFVNGYISVTPAE